MIYPLPFPKVPTERIDNKRKYLIESRIAIKVNKLFISFVKERIADREVETLQERVETIK